MFSVLIRVAGVVCGVGSEQFLVGNSSLAARGLFGTSQTNFHTNQPFSVCRRRVCGVVTQNFSIAAHVFWFENSTAQNPQALFPLVLRCVRLPFSLPKKTHFIKYILHIAQKKWCSFVAKQCVL